MTKLIWFELWREYKLSLAEIDSVFFNDEIIYSDKKTCIIKTNSNDIEKKLKNMWWIIKVFLITKNNTNNLENDIKEILNLENHSWKYNYAFNKFWKSKIQLKKILTISKNIIKKAQKNPRFINKNFENVSSAQIINEKLISKKTDFNIVFLNDTNYYIWHTIWVQDINSYSNRDYWKETDMNIWMLPPKLCQIMINIWKSQIKKDVKNIKIYDPFVWLWTILIEAYLMWIKKIYWSDISKISLQSSKENLEKLLKKELNKNIFFQNAKYINEVEILKDIDLIVTEWYLWEIMTKKNISIERIEKQKTKLIDLYNDFFKWLFKKYNSYIIISFPFWELNKKYYFFEEIYDIIEKYFEILPMFRRNNDKYVTKKWSLLYKRPNQLVWREIFYLKVKKNMI